MLLFNRATNTYFREEDHTYWSSDFRQIPSVSTVIKFNEPNFIKANGNDLHGSAVHRALEYYDICGEVMDGYELETGFWKDFLEKEQYEVVKVEIPVFCDWLWFAGKVDRVLRHIPNGELHLYDIKTGYLDRNYGGKQLNGYRIGLKEQGIEVSHLALIGISPKLNKKGWRRSDIEINEEPFLRKLQEHASYLSGFTRPKGLKLGKDYQAEIHDW